MQEGIGAQAIRNFMSPLPHSIEPNQRLDEARRSMGRHGVRHLPVLSGGRVVGLLSDRDISFLKAMVHDVRADLRVKDAMVYDPVIVEETESLQKVASIMAQEHIGSVLVWDAEHHLKGIFTYTDALQVLSQLS